LGYILGLIQLFCNSAILQFCDSAESQNKCLKDFLPGARMNSPPASRLRRDRLSLLRKEGCLCENHYLFIPILQPAVAVDTETMLHHPLTPGFSPETRAGSHSVSKK